MKVRSELFVNYFVWGVNEGTFRVESVGQSTRRHRRLTPPLDYRCIVFRWGANCTVGPRVKDTDPHENIKERLEVVRNLVYYLAVFFRVKLNSLPQYRH